MKRILLTAIICVSVYITVNAQAALSIYSGLGRSSFDEKLLNNPATGLVNFSQAEYVPLGAQFTYSLPFLLTFGAEINYAIVPYTFDVNAQINQQNMKVAELKIHQLMAGVLIKARLLPGPIVPYARVGAGIVSGNIDLNWDSQFKQLAQQAGIILQDSTLNVKAAIGVNLGAGVEINFSKSGGLFGEIVYYFIQREQDIKGAESFQANNYAIQIGWQFKFD